MALPNWLSDAFSKRKSPRVKVSKRYFGKREGVSVRHHTASAEVAAQLQAWSQQRALIWVSPPFESRYYQSMVLDVDLPSGLFLIDELFPYDGSVDLLLHQNFSVEVRLQTQHAGFKCYCTHVRKEEAVLGGPPAKGSPLVMRMPEVISVHQRRAGFRVDLNHIKDAFAKITLPEHESDVLFPLLDISSVGVALSVPADVAEDFPNKLDGILISVLDVMFEVSAIKRRSVVLPDGRYLIGLAFGDLLPAQRAKLERWILQLQRRLKRISLSQHAA